MQKLCSFRFLLFYLLFCCGLFACLFADTQLHGMQNSVATFLVKSAGIVTDVSEQWLLLLGCCAYILYFELYVYLHQQAELRRDRVVIGLQLGVFMVAIGSYVLNYPHASLSFQTVTLFFGACCGKSVLYWSLRRRKDAWTIRAVILFTILVLLLLPSCSWFIDVDSAFQGATTQRWTGPWRNPNTLGALTGAGSLLAIGLMIWQASQKYWWRIKLFVLAWLCIALCLVGHALVRSDSRGAWLGTVSGLFYFVVIYVKYSSHKIARWVYCNIFFFAAILLSGGIVISSGFCGSEWHWVHRFNSAMNENDFSWRNRITAWDGSLQILGEHPLLGVGWNRPEPLYENYYMPPKIVEGGAIVTNDYFTFGAALGLPALFCFVAYLWLALTQNLKVGSPNEEIRPDVLQTTCRAGAVVFLIVFWFDEGLFKLPIAVVFWMLLELGRLELRAAGKNEIIV